MSSGDEYVRKPRGIFERRPNVVFTHSLLRTWYVFLPLVGIWIASTQFIKPSLQKIRDEGTLQRLKNEQAGRQLLNTMNASEAVVRAAIFERDSVLTPAIDRRVFLVDSTRAIVSGERSEVLELSATVDSLEDATHRVDRRVVALADTLDAIAAEEARVDSIHADLNDSLTRLTARAVETWSRARETN